MISGLEHSSYKEIQACSAQRKQWLDLAAVLQHLHNVIEMMKPGSLQQSAVAGWVKRAQLQTRGVQIE